MFDFENYSVASIDTVVESSTRDSSRRFTTLMHNDSRHSASASKTPPVNSSLVSLKEKSLTPSPPHVDFVSYSHLRGLLSVPSNDDSEPSIETLPSEESESSSSSSSSSSESDSSRHCS